MEVLAKGRHIRISPKKVRPVANIVRGKNAHESQVLLSEMSQKAAKVTLKVIESAMANAENNFGLDKNKLVISEIRVDEGSVLKRYRPRAMGRASEIKKRTSHIQVVVSGETKAKIKASENNDEVSKINKKEIKENLSKKIEVERPQEKINLSASQKGNAQKIFRRKTG